MPSTSGCIYGILKDQLHRMAEKDSATRHSWYSNWKPAQPEASSRHSYLSNCPTVASLLVGTADLPSAPGHVDVRTRLGMHLYPMHSHVRRK